MSIPGQSFLLNAVSSNYGSLFVILESVPRSPVAGAKR